MKDLQLREIQGRLSTHTLGRVRLEVHDAIDSTNLRAFQLAAQGAPQGVVIAADAQTAGRGRRGRDWRSSPGVGLYASIILRYNASLQAPPLLTLAAGLAAAEAVEDATAVNARLKWPNDLLVDGRKLAGVLTEAGVDGDGGAFAVVGVGLNVNHEPPDLVDFDQATSLKMQTGRAWDRSMILAELLNRLELRACEPAAEDWSGMMNAYRARCETIGRRILVHGGGEPFPARAVAVSDDGALRVLRESDGAALDLDAGEVVHIRPAP